MLQLRRDKQGLWTVPNSMLMQFSLPSPTRVYYFIDYNKIRSSDITFLDTHIKYSQLNTQKILSSLQNARQRDTEDVYIRELLPETDPDNPVVLAKSSNQKVYGCFSKKKLKKNDYLGGMYGGELMTIERGYILTDLVKEAHVYFHDMGYKNDNMRDLIAAHAVGGPLRMLNADSVDLPGCTKQTSTNRRQSVHSFVIYVLGIPHTIYQMIRDVPANVEILTDYGEKYWSAVQQDMLFRRAISQDLELLWAAQWKCKSKEKSLMDEETRLREITKKKMNNETNDALNDIQGKMKDCQEEMKIIIDDLKRSQTQKENCEREFLNYTLIDTILPATEKEQKQVYEEVSSKEHGRLFHEKLCEYSIINGGAQHCIGKKSKIKHYRTCPDRLLLLKSYKDCPICLDPMPINDISHNCNNSSNKTNNHEKDKWWYLGEICWILLKLPIKVSFPKLAQLAEYLISQAGKDSQIQKALEGQYSFQPRHRAISEFRNQIKSQPAIRVVSWLLEKIDYLICFFPDDERSVSERWLALVIENLKSLNQIIFLKKNSDGFSTLAQIQGLKVLESVNIFTNENSIFWNTILPQTNNKKYINNSKGLPFQLQNSSRRDRDDNRQSSRHDRDGYRFRERGYRDRERGYRDRERGDRDRERGDRGRERGERDRERGERDRDWPYDWPYSRNVDRHDRDPDRKNRQGQDGDRQYINRHDNDRENDG
eukprot:GHVL01019325.1.p1 GENE.GHVL01019325.1~~GHVL01019325.1.p1  ORF type:complete len:717 (+),score=140.92 GHVL01019325.1:22-2151(+)